ncbi:MAG: chromosomal replication initiator protein DnaA [Clostridia bacterium]|nr:chromosomal replication initiator protein DnaA [Clostridia bacterium]
MNSASYIWSRVLGILGDTITPTAMQTWFNDCRAVALQEDRLVISAPSDTVKKIIESRYSGIIKGALYEIFSAELDILVLGEKELDSYLARMKNPPAVSDGEEYTFERFVVGSSNKFAHAAAMAVANEETKNFNPLFIYGDSGLGKTHLLCAIRNVVRKRHPEYNIVYVKGEDFLNELIAALRTGKTGENVVFREKYRNADLFLMDDIQIIGGKEQTQEEFFHTFNALYETNHQMIFSSDRPPNEMPTLTDRLKTRLESGLLADIQSPDYETRMAIIKNKSAQLGTDISEDVANYIAENMTSNVRQIEGAVKKITAYRALMGGDLNVTTVSKIIKDMVREKNDYIPTPEIIIEETAKYYSLAPDEVKGQSRIRNTALARQISMYLIRRLTNLSLKDIGDIFEGRDHSTVLSSVTKIEKEIENGGDMAQTVKDIMANINSKN